MAVFRPNRFVGCLFASAGLPFAIIGAACLAYGVYDGRGWRDWDGYLGFYFFYAFGIFFVIAGSATLAYRIEVDAGGISLRSWFGMVTYRDSWRSLKSWTTGKIEDEENDNRFYVEFDFDGRGWPFRIETFEVANLGFDRFLHEIRSRVGSKEKLQTARIA